MATKEDQDVFTKESLAKSDPLIKKFYQNMGIVEDKFFEITEGWQDAGKWGKKSGRQDDRP